MPRPRAEGARDGNPDGQRDEEVSDGYDDRTGESGLDDSGWAVAPAVDPMGGWSGGGGRSGRGRDRRLERTAGGARSGGGELELLRQQAMTDAELRQELVERGLIPGSAVAVSPEVLRQQAMTRTELRQD